MPLTTNQIINALKTKDVEAIVVYCLDNSYTVQQIESILEIKRMMTGGY